MAFALVFLGYTFGTVTQRFNLPPSSLMKEPMEGLFALAYQINSIYLDREAWIKAPTDVRGVETWDESATQPGYVLYTSADLHGARLIDQSGKLIHTWDASLVEMWTEDATIPKPADYSMAFAWKADFIGDEGDLIVLYAIVGNTPYGGGMARITMDGTVKWSLLNHIHHDFNYLPDGTILTLDQRWNTNPPPLVDRAGSRVMEDFVVFVDPDTGKITREISLLEAVKDSGFEWLYDGDSPRTTWDISHANSVRPLTADQASHLKGAKEGDFLISARELEAAIVLAPDTGKIVWAYRGQFFGQHDAEITPDGHLLVFDNLGRRARHDTSRVIEIDTESGQVVRNRMDESRQKLRSRVISGQQQLDDGNMLIIESMQGRVLEVDPAGKVVWSYINPVRAEPGVDEMPVMPYAGKIAPDQLPPAVKALIGAQ